MHIVAVHSSFLLMWVVVELAGMVSRLASELLVIASLNKLPV
jgi:hypothetical protein